jgi:hypothetical protein
MKDARTSMLDDDGCSSYRIRRPSCHFLFRANLGDVLDLIIGKHMFGGL